MKARFISFSIALISTLVSSCVSKISGVPKDLHSPVTLDLDTETEKMPQASNDKIPSPMPQIEPAEEGEDESEAFVGMVNGEEDLYDMPEASNNLNPLPMPELKYDDEAYPPLGEPGSPNTPN